MDFKRTQAQYMEHCRSRHLRPRTLISYGAIISKKHDNMRILLEAGANPDYVLRTSAADFTVLNYAIMQNDRVAFDLLMNAGANPNARRVSHIGGGDNPALCDAISERRYEMVERLLQAGADVDCVMIINNRRLSAMQCAQINDDKRMIDLLLSHGTKKAETRKAEDYHTAENEREEALARKKNTYASLQKVNSYYTKVVGVTFKNDDGSDRQRIIRDLSRNGLLDIGSELQLIHEPTNKFDRNCIQVVAMNGQQIGTLAKEQAARVAPDMASGRVYKAFVSTLTGGNVGYAYGINIRVEVYEAAKKEAGPAKNSTSTYHYSGAYSDYDIDDINSVAAGYGFSIDDDGHWVESSHNDDW